MVTSTRDIRFIAAGILLTLAAIVGREALPQRTLNLATHEGGQIYFMATASGSSEDEHVRWVDQKQFHFRCQYAQPGNYLPCAVTFMLSRSGNNTQGIDLRAYRSITLDLVYHGKADYLRVAVRNFDPRFSREEDANSARIHTINLRTRDVNGPVTLDLSELTVPEWWVSQYNLAREFNVPNLDNATSLTIDVPGNIAGPPHELQVRGLQFQGEWISREALYLGILCAWMLCAIATVGWWLADLRRQHRRQQGEIDALVARTTHLRSEQDRLRRLATIDELTGVLNRRGVEQSIADLAERGTGGGLAVVMVDIDHFKRVNDTHGHDAGDQVLRRVAAAMAQSVRANDILGRWGGEEFIVACANCPAEHAAVVAEKIRQRIEASAFGARPRIHVTASFGVAVAPSHEGFADALHRADAALYQAKSQGRNRVIVDGEPTTSAGASAVAGAA